MSGSRARVILLCAALSAPLGGRAADPEQGERLYELHCEVCHGEDGRGRVAGAPDFSRGQGLIAPDATLVRLLRVGRGSMPAYEGLLREHQLLDVIAYLRTLHQ